ncbi:MAG TPA: DUF5712 family protein [Mucilaginibacter sp.]|jgi:hypothetical protein|nr:DUF5712 family protein [Mucilaginibacter sp.]
MHINITKSETGNNKGRCSQLVAYLEKENRQAELIDKNCSPEYWFNNRSVQIEPYDVRRAIDNNIAKLSKDDAKFFLINISPSERELLFLKELYGEDGARLALKQYANELMNAYAKNFKRSGINSNHDLVYFGKLENNRYYTYKDLEVRKGLTKRGDKKPGEQMHIQIIVSRKDASNSIKLSPLNNSRGSNKEHSLKIGQFDRLAFKQSAENLFDALFSYHRDLKETFQYANTMLHGDYDQKQELMELLKAENDLSQQSGQYSDLDSIPSISIANDIDDEAVYGKYRQKKKVTRSSFR